MDVSTFVIPGALDVENLQENQPFAALPETYVIFLMEHDVGGFGDAVYPIERTFITHGKPFLDQAHLLYVNAGYRGDDDLGRLMHDFCCSNPDRMYTPLMAEASKRWKTSQAEVEEMCKIMEDIEKRGKKKEERRKAFRRVCAEESGVEFAEERGKAFNRACKKARQMRSCSCGRPA